MATQSPYYSAIQRYFPREQWENANCISVAECSPDQEGYPNTCESPVQGPLQCGDSPTVDLPKSYGVFGLLDVCWDPAINPLSPVPAEWPPRKTLALVAVAQMVTRRLVG